MRKTTSGVFCEKKFNFGFQIIIQKSITILENRANSAYCGNCGAYGQ